MANDNLFKEAIAEAKAIREAAISNAREALEESLTPHLKDMLAAKLREMEEEELDEATDSEEQEEMDEAAKSDDKESTDEAEDDSEESDDEAEDDEEEVEDDEPADDEPVDMDVDDVEANEDEEIGDMTRSDLEAMLRDIISQELQASSMGGEDMEGMDMDMDMDMEPEEGDDMEMDMDMEPGVDDMVGPEDEDDETISLDELLNELDKLTTESKKPSQRRVKEDPYERKYNRLKLDYNKAVKTVNTLKSQLNEVNLLNAKLLYVNKIFKTNSLNESNKANVIASFDRAKSVKEVKLIYKTISENFTRSSVRRSRTNINEHRSFASKPTGTTAKREVISEVDEQIRRMQKLAGIIK